MPVLEIHRRTGDVETRELSKQIPLLVGRLPTNDIRIEGDGIAPVHCRISWNRRNFEVAAVTPAGVEWNGATVQQAMLSSGDVVRVGNVEIVLQAELGGAAAENAPGSPVLPVGRLLGPKAALAEQPEAADDDGERPAAPGADTDLPVRAFHFSDELSDDSERPLPEPRPVPETASPPAVARRAGMNRVVGVPPLSTEHGPPETSLKGPAETEEERKTRELLESAARLKQKLKVPMRRPGEQEVLRSPVVVGLLVGTLLLLLSAATIWFVLSREAAQHEFDAARALMESGQFAQSVEAFEQFLRDRPRHRLAPEARLAIATAKVEQPMSGGVPAWDAGLEALGGFIAEYRDTDAFHDAQSTARKYVLQTADRIAFGAAETARTAHKRPLLVVSADAAKMLVLYSPSEAPPNERLEELARAVRAAEASILQQETFDGMLGKLDAALAANTPLAALPEYRRLLDRYPAATDYRLLNDRLKKTLDLGRSQIVRDESRREAIRENRAPPQASPPLTLARRIRTRSDATSAGGTVFVVAEDAVYGVDAANGEPLWRRVIGLDTAFQPLAVTAGVPSLLLYDGRFRELVLVQQRTGELLWRAPLDDRPQGPPLVFEGQILVATAGGALEQIDVQSGASTSRLRFKQGLVGPPVVSLSGERLYVPGHSDLLYVLSRRPLACEQVVWLGHGPGAIETPPLMLRAILLLAENDRLDGSRLRAFDTSRENQAPRPLAEQRVEGQVRDSPAVRGKQLVVPSSPERISAFTVAETGDEQSLSFVAAYQVKSSRGGPMYVAIGPDDQLWMTSSSVRRFTISRDSLLPEKQELAVGLASQPLQIIGDSLYVGRRLSHSRAVLFSEADRLRMTTQWQTSVGARLLGCTAPSLEGTALCVTGLGDLFQVTPQRAARGGFELEAFGQLAVPDGVSESLAVSRLADGRLTISCGGAEPRLWITGTDGVVRESRLPSALQADPVLLGPGVLIPVSGRLRLLSRNLDAAIAEDLPAPVSDAESPAWRSAAALDDTQVLVLDARGRLARIQFRTSPVAHLAEVTHWDAGRPVDQKLAVDRGRVLVADTAGRVVMLDASSFETLGEVRLEQPARQTPWPVGDQVFIEVASVKLVCCDSNEHLKRQWELSLEGESLAGAPIRHEGRLLIALMGGRLLLVDPESGKIARQIDLAQRLCFGPQLLGDRVIVGTLDGSLLVVNSWLEQGP